MIELLYMGEKMKKLSIGLIIILMSFVVGCTSLPNAANRNHTLLIGQVVLEARGMPASYVSINGTHKVGIEITIQNVESGRTYSVLSQNEGLFTFTDIPEGNYIMSKLYFKRTSGNAWRDIWTEPRRNQFRIQEGYVNNVGIISWHSEDSRSLFNANKEYEQVRNFYQERFRSSNWNEKEWRNTSIGL